MQNRVLNGQFVMNSLLRCEKKNGIGRRSSMVAPPLPGISIPFLHTPPLKVSRSIPTIVTGLIPPLLFYEGRSVNRYHRAGDCLHLVYKHALQQPDYTDKATRLQSFKYWNGLVSPLELVDAGFYMIAAPRDTVRCYSCDVEIANWRKGDSPIDVHCLLRPNCDFVKNYMEKLNEMDGNMASHEGRVGNYGPSSERLIIKGRVKRGDSSINSAVGPTAPPSSDNISNSPQVINHLIAGINYPVSHRSMNTQGHEVKDSDNKSSEEMLESPPQEEIVFSERRLCVNSSDNVQEDEAIVPKMMCKMCHINRVDRVFLPCGDAKTCEGCAIRWYKSGRPCYFCGRLVATTHQIYL